MNATGRPLAAEDATGLRRLLPIFHAPRFRDREFARDDGTPSGIYRVEAPSWAFRIHLSRGRIRDARRPGRRRPRLHGRRDADRDARSIGPRPVPVRDRPRERSPAHRRAPPGQHDPLVGRRAQPGRAAAGRAVGLVDRAGPRPVGAASA